MLSITIVNPAIVFIVITQPVVIRPALFHQGSLDLLYLFPPCVFVALSCLRIELRQIAVLPSHRRLSLDSLINRERRRPEREMRRDHHQTFTAIVIDLHRLILLQAEIGQVQLPPAPIRKLLAPEFEAFIISRFGQLIVVNDEIHRQLLVGHTPFNKPRFTREPFENLQANLLDGDLPEIQYAVGARRSEPTERRFNLSQDEKNEVIIPCSLLGTGL